MTVAPKIHNLSYLVEKTDLELSEEQLLLCDTLMFYQLEGRYPAFFPKPPDIERAQIILKNTETFFAWLKKKL